MQIHVEATGTLGRRMIVKLPADRIDHEVEGRLKSLVRTARLPGFRPGKVPLKVVQQKYQDRVRSEVVGKLIETSLKDALARESLRPAGNPAIDVNAPRPGQDLEYTADFEIYPDVQVVPLAGLRVERPMATVGEADVDAMIETLRSQRVKWQPAGRAAALHDRVTVRYRARPVGQETLSEPKEFNFVLGSQTPFAELEQRLIGAIAGQHIEYEQAFPTDFPDAKLAGLAMHCDVELLAIDAPQYPELDAEFARGFGISDGSMEMLRAEVRANMERELKQVVTNKVKDQVMDAVLAAHAVDAPRNLIEAEIDALRTKAGNAAHPRETYREAADRRVRLGLILSEFVKRHGLKPDPERVRALVASVAANYEEPQEVISWYYSDPRMLLGMESIVLEDTVVEHLLKDAEVIERPTSFSELMNPRPAIPTA